MLRLPHQGRSDEVDRPPVGFWGHDFLREWSAEDLDWQKPRRVTIWDYEMPIRKAPPFKFKK